MANHVINKKLLFLPFLQIPSGHHQVADALMEAFNQAHPHIETAKVDILSYSYGRLERLISNVYLKWIHAFPSLYNMIYRISVYKSRDEQKRYRLYEFLFMPFMKRLLRESKPDFIICSHALPSYLLSRIKEQDGLPIPVLNVYTDYFIHNIWGIKHIDHHFAPTLELKQHLINNGVKAERIYVTGIPIHQDILRNYKKIEPLKPSSALNILISGGSMGAGQLEKLIKKISTYNDTHYYVLCGKNKSLYRKLTERKERNIIPLEYISCRKKMGELYDMMDAVITKPGGVTISECLHKRKPMFVYHSLPGQEKINMETLRNMGLVLSLENWESDTSIEEQLISILNDPVHYQEFQDQINLYHLQLHPMLPSKIIEDLLIDK
ncbi:UDP-N-acetylglucosamine:LPS N-acetylglucosamine transferase [Peribacillus deserti]|uniref:UDP-N-acetylglucosamine:LPS N-acetylglucosamine transferase n=1 Tax=Peribacillus deserti TaxID=673318 RepID=A0ABS2QDD0_9BACI|nr:glycosyltransferase [Peribacillus deserti]MBM7691171.1 UDP-N-acetylglucosamine:LPS N-acetylglucosamine transferase [Peribacillus deserti]